MRRGNSKRRDALTGIIWIGIVSFGAAFFALRKFMWNPIAVMLACGAEGLVDDNLPI